MKAVQPLEAIITEEPEIHRKSFSPSLKGMYHLYHLGVDGRDSRKMAVKEIGCSVWTEYG